MWGGVKVKVVPQALPLSIGDLRQRVRLPETGDTVQDAADADLLEQLQAQAVAQIDGPDGIGWAMQRQTWTRTAAGFDDLRGALLLPGAPFASVIEVRYMGPDGIWSVLDPAAYRVIDGREPARLVAVGSWPSLAFGDGVVSVDYLMGPEPGLVACPALLAAVSLLVGHYLENVEAVAAGISMAEIPLGPAHILQKYSRTGAA